MALAQPKPHEAARPRIRNPRSARTATQTRIVKNTRARYGSITRIVVGLSIALVAVMTYLALLSNTTSLSYALTKAQRQRDALQEQTARLDDRMAQLTSEERLAAIAAKLKMHDPQRFAVVRIEPAPHVASHFPVFDTIAAWFGGGAARARTH
jgi:cell division protein FtsL